jgi:hypothetical protein
VSAPDPTGIRNVADLVLVENATTLTRLAGDSLRPVWRMLLPHGADGIEMGESDFAAEAITHHGDTLVLNASVPPGNREFTLTYRVPAGSRRFEIPVDHGVASADVLSEEPGLTVEGGFARGDTLTVVERHFTKWSGPLTAGTPLVLSFPTSTTLPNWALPTLIGALGAGLLAMSVVANRRAVRLAAAGHARSRPTQPAAPRAGALSADAQELLTRIATLDAAHQGGPSSVSPEAWEAYLHQRAEWKARLTDLLPR